MRRLLLGVIAVVMICVLIALSVAVGGETELTGTNWTLTSLNHRSLAAVSRPTLRFRADGTATGWASCNHFWIRYEADDGKLRVSEGIGRTDMACADPAENRQEDEYLTALQEAGSYHVSDGSLEIRDTKGRPTLAFRADGESELSHR